MANIVRPRRMNSGQLSVCAAENRTFKEEVTAKGRLCTHWSISIQGALGKPRRKVLGQGLRENLAILCCSFTSGRKISGTFT